MSSVDVGKRSSAYRKIYFKHNKGIFKKWYLCAYCKSKFLEQDIVEVDHIIPVYAVQNKWQYRMLFTILGTNVNTVMNLAAACRKCNREKSKKTKNWVARGYKGTILHKTLQLISLRLMTFFKAFWLLIFVGVLGVIVYLAFKLKLILG